MLCCLEMGPWRFFQLSCLVLILWAILGWPFLFAIGLGLLAVTVLLSRDSACAARWRRRFFAGRTCMTPESIREVWYQDCAAQFETIWAFWQDIATLAQCEAGLLRPGDRLADLYGIADMVGDENQMDDFLCFLSDDYSDSGPRWPEGGASFEEARLDEVVRFLAESGVAHPARDLPQPWA